MAVAFDCPVTYMTFILLFDHSLIIPGMHVHLACPDQMREHGITVNDIPLLRLPAHQRNHDSHSVIDSTQSLHIPLLYDKPISYFNVRNPTLDECSDYVNNRIV